MDTMAERSIMAQLVSTFRCEAHWTIIVNKLGECTNADLSGNTLLLQYLKQVLSTIEFRINDGCPPIDELKEHMWLPDHLTKRRGSCHCVQWV